MTALMVIVLGSIFAGWATPTESGAVGVLGSMLIAALNKRLTIKMMNEAIFATCRANGLVFMIFLGATGFSYVFRVLGGDDVMISTLTYFGITTKWEMLTFIMVLIFLLGFPFEWIEICLIVLPIFGPILMKFDFSDHLGGSNAGLMTWFGTLVAVNLQTAFMTPPFGATLFYMKGTAPPGVTMRDVYRAMYPFVGLQVVGLFLCIWFPRSRSGCRGLPGSSTERASGERIPGTEGNERPPAAFVPRSLSSAQRSKMFAYVAILGSLVTLSLISFIAGALAG